MNQIKNILGITKELTPSEIVILYYKSKEISIEEVYNIFTKVKDELPDNKVIAIPDLINIKTCNKERLIAIRNAVDEMIKEIESEENV